MATVYSKRFVVSDIDVKASEALPGTVRKRRLATVHVSGRGSNFSNPLHGIAKAISDALDPTRAPSKGRSFKDMTDEERAAMKKLYGG